MRTLLYTEYLTGLDNDILAGSELEYAPGNGVYVIRAASTVNTALLAVNGNRQPITSSPRGVPIRSGPEVRASDPNWTLRVSAGEKITCALSGTTGTCFFSCSYLGQ